MYGLDRSGMFGVDANGQEYGMLGDEKVPIGLRREEMLMHNNYFMDGAAGAAGGANETREGFS